MHSRVVAASVEDASERMVERLWLPGSGSFFAKSVGALRHYRSVVRQALRRKEELRLVLVAPVDKRNEFFNSLRGELPAAHFKLRVSDWRERDVTLTHPTKTALRQFLAGRLKDYEDLAFGRIFYGDSGSVRHYWSTYLLWKASRVDSEDIAEVKLEEGDGGFPHLRVECTASGARALGKLTRQNVGERLAVRVGEEVITAPVIDEAAEDGSLRLPLISPTARNEPMLLVDMGPTDG